MTKARLIISALFVERQTPSEVARRYGVHRAWVYKLKARYLAEGEAALRARSRRPHRSPTATPAATVELVLALRKQLASSGLDAGADTISWHLINHHQIGLSRSTIHRILSRAGTITPDPKKRPKSSYLRFQAEQPNQTWQSDFTHYPLTTPDGRPGADTEIITWLDDHSRKALHITGESPHRSCTTRSEQPLPATGFPHPP
jgi:transposase